MLFFFFDSRKHGADVDIGMPSDMWDIPSLESMRLKRSVFIYRFYFIIEAIFILTSHVFILFFLQKKIKCDTMLELYEEDIEDWFFNHRKKVTLTKYLCEDIVLKDGNKRESTFLFILLLLRRLLTFLTMHHGFLIPKISHSKLLNLPTDTFIKTGIKKKTCQL
jgi:hypothetical protein